MPLKYCEVDGCSNYVEHGKYCAEHASTAKYKRAKTKRKSAYHHDNKDFYHTRAWQSLSQYVYERDEGKCQRCGIFVFGRRAHRHHIVPIRVDPTLRLEPNNIILLCPKCHEIVENEDKNKKVYPSYFSV